MITVSCVPLPNPPPLVHKIGRCSDSLGLVLGSSGRRVREVSSAGQNAPAPNVPIETARITLIDRVISGVLIGLPRNSDERVLTEELRRRRVVVAVDQRVEFRSDEGSVVTS